MRGTCWSDYNNFTLVMHPWLHVARLQIVVHSTVAIFANTPIIVLSHNEHRLGLSEAVFGPRVAHGSHFEHRYLKMIWKYPPPHHPKTPPPPTSTLCSEEQSSWGHWATRERLLLMNLLMQLVSWGAAISCSYEPRRQILMRFYSYLIALTASNGSVR